MARKKKIASATRRLHRSLGAIASLFVLFMVVSGISINHATVLGLDKQHVSQARLLEWYGIGEPDDLRSFKAGDHWLSFAGSGLYFDGSFVASLSNGVGAVSSGNMLIAAGGEELLLLGLEGELVERVAWNQQDSGKILSIGLLQDGIVALQSERKAWIADDDLLQWHAVDEHHADPLWSEPAQAPEPVRQSVSLHFRGDGVSLERLLLDLHSGRFFGPAGALVYDLLAAAIGFLAISGLVLWVRGRRNGHKARTK